MKKTMCRSCGSTSPKFTISNIVDERIQFCNQECASNDPLAVILIANDGKVEPKAIFSKTFK